MLREHYAFTWRQLRRLGLPADHAEDATQQVLLIAARRIAEIEPGRERSFLFGTARRVASDFRRTAGKLTHGSERLREALDTAPLQDELLDRERDRARLDDVLESMDDDLRAVFILYELEELTMAEMAEVLELPAGTVASRLRRARTQFRQAVRRLQASLEPRRAR